MKRWSKLQRQLYLIIDDAINFQIHCAVYKMKKTQGENYLPRYWITLGKEIIFDYPHQFMHEDSKAGEIVRSHYPFDGVVCDISAMIKGYIYTPAAEAINLGFKQDYWRLVDILRAADRRIGLHRLVEIYSGSSNDAVNKIIAARLQARGKHSGVS